MKTRIALPLFVKTGLLLGLFLVILACQVGSFAAPTATPVPTNTTLPTDTSTPEPTSTPRPTSTPKPTATIQPTPAPVGETVTYGSLEITLLKVTTHDLIVPGGKYYWYSKSGQTFVDLGVLVRNLEPGNPVTVTWDEIYIVDVNGDSWYANFGDTKMVDTGTKVDPYSIGINDEVTGGAMLNFDNDTYLRLVYYTFNDPEKPVFFGIANSPQMTFTIKR